MNDHLTLKKLKALLPPEAYGRIAAADVVHKLTGENLAEKFRAPYKNGRLDEYPVAEFFMNSRKTHQTSHGLVGGDCYYAKSRASSKQDVGTGRLSHFSVVDYDAHNFVDQRILGELVVPKANLHLVGPVLAELNHIYAKKRAEWERSGPSRRNRIRNVRRLRGLRKLCWPIPRKHLKIGARFPKESDETFALRRSVEAELVGTSGYAPVESFAFDASYGSATIKLDLRLSKLRHRRIYRKLLAVIAEERAWEKEEKGGK